MEEKEQDWKEQRISEYLGLENEIATETLNMDTDPELLTLIKQLEELAGRIKTKQSNYLIQIEAAQQRQAGIKLDLVQKWDIYPEKTFECDAGKATLRTTRSLIIQDTGKLIDFLTLNKKLVEYIKSFDITKLRKIKDAGFLNDEIAIYDEKQSIAIAAISNQIKEG